MLPVHRLPAALSLSSVRDDYLPDSLRPCSIGHTISSSIIIANVASDLPPPSILGDFFDPGSYPGQRALQRTPRGLAERALLANGVAEAQLYKLLSQPALAWPIIESALNGLHNQIGWVDNDQIAIEAVASGRASFAMVSGASAARYAAHYGQANWQPLWDQALYQIHSWAIPASSTRQAAAWQLIQQLATPQINGRYATAAGNGPARLSAVSLVNIAYQQLLPSHPDNMRKLVLQNDQWWHRNGAEYEARFRAWQSQHETRNTALPWSAPLAQLQSNPASPTALPAISSQVSAP